MKKILLSILIFAGMNVGVYAEVESRANDYVYDDAYGYAVPAGSVCQKYVDIIKEKEIQIKALKQEIASLQGGEQQDLQQQLKTKYDKEMKAIDEKRLKRDTKKTTSSIVISDKPVP